MQRYFFHLYNDEICHDQEGVMLPNDALAMQRAIECAREMAAESVKLGHLILDHRIEVERQTGGEKVAIVHFRDAVEVKG